MRPHRLVAAFALAAVLAAAPAAAQAPSQPELRLPEKLDEAFRDMMERLKPAFEDMLETMRVFEDIDGIEHYERPEILPNGDIIIRRRDDAPPWPPEDREAPGEDAEDWVRT